VLLNIDVLLFNLFSLVLSDDSHVDMIITTTTEYRGTTYLILQLADSQLSSSSLTSSKIYSRTSPLHSDITKMGNRRPAGRIRPLTSFDPALIHFSELTNIKLTSYDLRKTHHVFSHQGLFCDSSKSGYSVGFLLFI
jgi:hypothetical protein